MAKKEKDTEELTKETEIKNEEPKKEEKGKEEKKKNKLPIIVGIILALLLVLGVIVGIKVGSKNDEKDIITIKFDADGGDKIDDIKLKKGEKLDLPTTVKDGYNFLGWYKDGDKVENNTEFKKDTTLFAKWEAIPEDAKTMEVSFDTDGGNKIDSIKMECDKPLSLPGTPKKNGYSFEKWVNEKNETVSKGDKLECKDIKLKAIWKEEKKEEPKKEEPKKEEKPVEKKYTCPDGYTLEGNKCFIVTGAKLQCPKDTYEFQGKCITLTYSAQNSDQVTRVCGKTTVVVDNNGHTQEVEGVVKYAGYYYCAYSEVSESQSTCTSHGYKWIDNKCYRTSTGPGVNISYSCKSNTYTYLTTDQANSLRKNSNISGCFPATGKSPVCPDGYSLYGSGCMKTIEATLE